MNRLLPALFLAAAATCTAAPFAYVPRLLESAVTVVDLGSNAIVTRVGVGSLPLGVATDPVRNRVYVTNEGNTVSVISTLTHSLVGTITTEGREPFGAAVNPAGTRVAVALSGDVAPGNTVEVFDTTTLARVARIVVGSGPTGVVFNAAGTRLYVSNTEANSISVVDTATFAVIATLQVPEGPLHMAINPAGTRLYVSHIGSQTVAVRAVSVVDLVGGASPVLITVGEVPFGIALSPAGDRLLVANTNSDNVSVVDTATNRVVATVVTGAGPRAIAFHANGSRFYVVAGQGAELGTYDTATLQRLSSVPLGAVSIAFGNMLAPQSASGHTPGSLSGLYWNPAESGWGASFTQRGSIVFAAWYTYDSAGRPKWYVASDCRLASATFCSGPLYQVTGPRYFGVPFDPAAVRVSQAGTLSVDFGNLFMTYTVAGQSRTVPIARQVFASGATQPAVNYTDLWWNAGESGWGLAVTHQFGVMFLAWYVYDATGNPVWYVASGCAVTAPGNGCSGTLYRTTGPPFGPAFDPARVQVVPVGSASLAFTDANNGTLTFTVDGVQGTKAITRQLF